MGILVEKYGNQAAWSKDHSHPCHKAEIKLRVNTWIQATWCWVSPGWIHLSLCTKSRTKH